MTDHSKPSLLVTAGPLAGERRTLEEGETIIGRDEACAIQVEDDQASRRHALLRLRGSLCEVEDLQSTNGVWVNGERVSRRMVSEGDVIQIGVSAFCLQDATEIFS